MIAVDMVPIVVPQPAAVRVIPTRPVTPIPRRVPASPIRSPEPVINDRGVDIHRLYNVVGSIDVFISYHLRSHLLCGRVLLHVDRRYVLKNILG